MTPAAAKSVDLLIVGAGPVGLFGAYYAGVRRMSTSVLDSLEEPGGRITQMYSEKAIFDIAGFPPTVPGIYAAGDIVDCAGKANLTASGYGEVATAVNNAAAYLNRGVSAFPGHLSDSALADGVGSLAV